MMKFKLAILVVTAGFLLEHPCQAKPINSASGAYADVVSACNSAAPGDVVMMPPGTNVWPQTLYIPSGVSLIGAGMSQTTIICDNGGGSGNICAIACNALSGNYITRISSFTLQGTNVANYNDWGCIWMNVNSSSPAYAEGSAVPWRIDHVVFNQIPMQNIKVYNVHSGLIDNCVFNLNQQISGQILRLVNSDPMTGGSYSWSVNYPYGGTNALYVENCFFTNSVNSLCALTDCNGGGSIVLRYNTSYNCQYNNHGTESSGNIRSQRSYEIYGNTFIANNSAAMQNPALLIRGGSGVIFSNTIIGWAYNCTLDNFRSGSYFPPFNGAYGANPWDLNDPTVYLSNVWTNDYMICSNNTLTVPGANWTPNQWIGYTIWNTNSHAVDNALWNNAPQYTFAQVWSNTTNTLTLQPPKDTGGYAPYLTLFNGDTYQLHKVIKTLDQVGLGSGDSIGYYGTSGTLPYDNTTHSSASPVANEVAEPLYWWGNTMNGGVTSLGNNGFFNIVENRDFYNNTAKPGYTPLAYPHPLVYLTNSTSGTNVSTSSSLSNKLAPPSQLAVAIKAAAPANVTNNLLAWYRFSEGSGLTTADSSGAGNAGTLVASPTWSTGPNGGGALTFNGVGQCVLVKSGAIVGGRPAWSITCWVQLTDDVSILPFYSESSNGGSDQIILGTRGGWPYYPQIYYQNDAAAFNATVAGTTAAPDGAWHFVAATFNGSTITLYVDGVAEGTPQPWSSNNNFTDAGIQSVIAGLNGSGRTFGGSEADVRLYSAALNQTQVASLYTAGAQ